MSPILRTPLLLTLSLGLLSCSEMGLSDDMDFGGPRSDAGGEADADTDADNDLDDDAPPEEEDDFLAMSPSQTDVYVFVANPARGTLTRIDVFTLDVRTIEVGLDPRVVRVTPDYGHAVVFNAGEDTVSIVDADTLDVTTVQVRDNYNQLLLSEDGSWAGVFHDRSARRADDPPPDGLQSFNEVSLVKVPEGTVHDVVVSYNPRDIKFSADGTLAVVVSDEELALVDLTAETLVPRMVEIGDPFDPPRAEEVVLTRNGQYAYVRQFAADDLLLVDLDDRTSRRLPAGSNTTDLDLSPDGSLAVAVARSSGQVWVYEAEQPDLPPKVLELPESLQAGSVLFDRTGQRGILYTTVDSTSRFAVWDTVTDELDVEQLVKPVDAMALTPDGNGLLVVHGPESLPETPPEFVGSHALTLLSLDDRPYRSNAIKLPAEPIGFVNAADGQNGYFIMDGETRLVQLAYDTLLYRDIPLKSVPVYVGVLPDLDAEDGVRPPAWASQEHPLGRITFFHPDDNGGRGSTETITGFELNGRIEE
jgi:DNA-binding beta-propeller fold protein YncE